MERGWQVVRRLRARIDDATESALRAEHNISVTEYLALAALAYSDDGGHLRQQVLAHAIPLDQSSVSRLVARLERGGLSERYLCDSDRRGVYTQITPRGRALLSSARATYLQALQTALADASADPEMAPHVARILGT